MKMDYTLKFAVLLLLILLNLSHAFAAKDNLSYSNIPESEIVKDLYFHCSQAHVNQIAIAVGSCLKLTYASEDLTQHCADNLIILQEDNKKHFAVLFRTKAPRRGQVGFNNSKKLLFNVNNPTFNVDIVTRGDKSRLDQELKIHEFVKNDTVVSGLKAVGTCKREKDDLTCNTTLSGLKSANGKFKISKLYSKVCG